MKKESGTDDLFLYNTKRKIYVDIIIGILLFIFLSCSNPNQDPETILSEIMIADNAADVERIVSLYTDDAMLIPAGKPNISGNDAIRKNYENIFSSSRLQLSAKANEVIESGKTAIIIGNTTGNVNNLKDSSIASVNDKFIMLLKAVNGKWKIYRLMWGKDH